MAEIGFVAILQRATTGELAFGDLIAAAQQLTQSGQPAQAKQLYQVWLAMNGEHPLAFIAHFNSSTLMAQLGDAAGAEAALKAALQRNPDFAPAHINLGSALERRGAAREAVEQWKAGLERLAALTGDAIEYKVTLLKQISRVMTDNQQNDGAETVLAQCLDLNPEQRDVIEQYAAVRLAQCKWPIAETPAKLTRKGFISRFHPLSTCAYADDPLLQLATAHRYVEALAPIESISSHADRRDASIDINRRLKIGYVSSDLRGHAVGYLMAQLFEAHDAHAIETFVYYCGPPADDGITQRFKASVEHWIDIRALSDDEAAARIAADGIDILVDVNGHTREARLGVFARRPAPVIVNWLGYPGTMGSPFHHYIIGDEWIIPPESEQYYSERVLRLPCYQPNDTMRQVAERTPTRAEAGLPDNAFVFCCFNAAHKITRFAFARWMKILRATPGSVLWLLDYNDETNARMRAHAEVAGVVGERLVFAKKIANPHHLARYPLADLFLDTVPYGAHTTASDALWMGVPVLTYSGRSFAARVCGSLVRAAGVPELVCESPEAFVQRAIALAGPDRLSLRAYRERLIAGRDTCTLFDIDLLARKLESLYSAMVAIHARGETPTPNLTNLDAYLSVGASFDHDAIEIGQASDYHAIYATGLAAIHRHRPLAPDNRIWTRTQIDAARTKPAPATARSAA
jgi:predicted O-linked N-acetylglucosamine transferase (SPINDLY family)